MGKRLIVKGADFSTNGIGALWEETTVIQGFINTNSGSSNYGKIYISSGSAFQNNIQCKILIPAGHTISVKVLANDSMVTDLNVGYAASANNVAYVDGNKVNDIVEVLHPATNSIRESDGSFTVANTNNQDLYFYIYFTYDTSSGPAISATGKRCLYKRVNTN